MGVFHCWHCLKLPTDGDNPLISFVIACSHLLLQSIPLPLPPPRLNWMCKRKFWFRYMHLFISESWLNHKNKTTVTSSDQKLQDPREMSSRDWKERYDRARLHPVNGKNIEPFPVNDHSFNAKATKITKYFPISYQWFSPSNAQNKCQNENTSIMLSQRLVFPFLTPCY